jgi:hypothetical protein
LLGVAVLGSLFVPLGSAHAATPPSWSLQPTATPGAGQAARPYFLFTVSPGEQVSDSATLYNPTQSTLHLRLFASDAYNTVRGGGFALHTSPQPNKDAGDWIKLPVTEFNVEPLTGVKIPYNVDIPKNAEPGDHVAGIVALDTATSSTEQKEGVTVLVHRAVGARVYIRVQGPLHPNLDVPDISLDVSKPVLTPFGSGDNTVAFTLTNTGNTRQSPKVHVWVTDVFGRTVQDFKKFAVPDLVPGGHADIVRQWSGSAGVGLRLTAHVTAESTSASASATTNQFVVPWLLVIIVVALLVALIWARRRRRGRRRAGAPAPAGAS